MRVTPSPRHLVTSSPRRHLAALGLLAVVATLGGLEACRKPDPAAAAAQGSATLLGPENVAVVTRGRVRGGPVISGTLTPVRNAQIRAQVSGPVLRVGVEQGQHVVAGQQLAEIDATALRDAYLSARTALAAAQTAASYAARQVQRYDTLFAAGAVSDRDHETVVQQDAQAQAALTDAKSRLAAAQKELGNADIRAPFAGVAAERNVSAGDVVQPGTMLFSVVDPSELQLEAMVPAEEIGAVRVGQPVVFSLNAYGDRSFTGKVSRINAVVDPSTRQVQLFATIPNARNALVAGLFATGRVVTDSAEGLLAPSEAVDTRNLRPAVERVRGGRVERVDVQLGLRDVQTDRVQITAGVAGGDTLLRGSAQGLTPGTPVRVTTLTDTTTAER